MRTITSSLLPTGLPRLLETIRFALIGLTGATWIRAKEKGGKRSAYLPDMRGLTCRRVAFTLRHVPADATYAISVTNDGKDLTYLHIRWNGKASEGLLSIGDHWERSYGDLEWRGTIPERVMP
jgi:hypothetical protein